MIYNRKYYLNVSTQPRIMNHRFRITAAMIFFIALFIQINLSGILHAQDTTTIQKTSADSIMTKPASSKAIPAFDVPDFVIMGNEKASAAQKILLNLYNSEAFTERSGVGTRETSYSNYASPQLHSLMEPLPGCAYNGYAKVGVGRFLSSYAEAWYARKLMLGDFEIHGLYDNSKKFELFPGHTLVSIDLTGGSYIHPDAASLFAKSRVQGNFVFMYNDFPFASWSLSQPVAPDQNVWNWYRTIKQIQYGGEIISRDNKLFDYQAGLSAEHTILNHRNRLSSTDTNYPSVVENIFSLKFGAAKDWSSYHWSGNMKASAYAFSNDASPYNKVAPFYFTSSGYTQKSFWNTLEATAGVELFLYRGTWSAIQFRFFPSLSLDYLLDPQWNVFLQFNPKVAQTSLSTMLQVDPYLYYPALQHQENRIDIKMGGRYDDKSSLSITSFVQYLQVYNYPAYSWFIKSNESDLNPALSHPYYEGASDIFSVHVTGSKYFSVSDELQISAVIRSSKNSDTKRSLTYLPNAEITSTYAHTFEFPLTLRGNIIIVGERQVFRYSSDKKLDGYVFIGLESEYTFAKQFGAFIKISNLFNQQYSDWYGYNAQPLYVLIGVSATF